MNVGNIYDYRSYIEGDTKSEAIFTLNDIDESDLIEGRLPLEIRLDVFRTYNTGREFTMAEITLRNPQTGLTSEPIRIEAKSYVNRRLNIPRKLTAIDQDGKKREVDLLKGLVSKGRLEVVLQGTLRGIYIGVGSNDLNLRPLAFEYVYLNDREIVVAESAETLDVMLQNATKSVAMSERLSQPGEIVVAGNVKDEAARMAFQKLARLISNGPNAELWGDSVTELAGSLRLDRSKPLKVTAKFEDRPKAEKAGWRGRVSLRRMRREVGEIISKAIDRVTAKGNLAAIGMDGVSFAFPRDDSLTTEDAISAFAKPKTELLNIIHESLDNLRIDDDENEVTILFTPPKSLSNLSEPAIYAWAKMDASLAEDLFNREKFDLSDEIFQRATQRIPKEPGAWFYRAWHLSYNVPAGFDGYQTRYSWARRGIEALLDGAEKNPRTADMLGMAARFIGHKIGGADDRKAFRELFSKDADLHKRLANYIDLEKARTPEKKIDNWLAAKLLFEECVRRQEKDGAASTILPALFDSRPAVMQARYAEAVARQGHWDESQRAWEEAEKLHKELAGRKALDQQITDRVLSLRRADHDKKITVPARQFLRHGYWLTRCRLEQTKELQSARKLAYEAAEHAKQSDEKKAKEGYRRSVEILAELDKKNPDAMSLMYGDLKDIAKGYRWYHGRTDDESLAPLLEAIEKHDALSNYPLSPEPRGYESILDYLN